MDVSALTVEQFIFDGMIEGFTLFAAFAIVWHPIGAVRSWCSTMLGG